MAAPRLPAPPPEYERQYFDLFNQALTNYFNTLDNPGLLRGTSLQLSGFSNPASTTQALVLPMSTTLTATALVGDTTLSVVSTTDFTTTGVVTIENEKIAYTGVTSTTITGCTRGQLGTTAAEHAVDSVVVNSGQVGAVYRNPLTSQLLIVP